MLIHAGGFNLGLLMRQLIGVGTPRGLQGRLVAAVAALLALIRSMWEPMQRPARLARPASPRGRRSIATDVIVPVGVSRMAFTTGAASRCSLQSNAVLVKSLVGTDAASR